MEEKFAHSMVITTLLMSVDFSPNGQYLASGEL